MMIGDKVICVKDYITFANRLIYSAGEVHSLSNSARISGIEFVWVGDMDLMMMVRDGSYIIDLADADVYFISLKILRREKLKKLRYL